MWYTCVLIECKICPVVVKDQRRRNLRMPPKNGFEWRFGHRLATSCCSGGSIGLGKLVSRKASRENSMASRGKTNVALQKTVKMVCVGAPTTILKIVPGSVEMDFQIMSPLYYRLEQCGDDWCACPESRTKKLSRRKRQWR